MYIPERVFDETATPIDPIDAMQWESDKLKYDREIVNNIQDRWIDPVDYFSNDLSISESVHNLAVAIADKYIEHGSTEKTVYFWGNCSFLITYKPRYDVVIIGSSYTTMSRDNIINAIEKRIRVLQIVKHAEKE